MTVFDLGSTLPAFREVRPFEEFKRLADTAIEAAILDAFGPTQAMIYYPNQPIAKAVLITGLKP